MRLLTGLTATFIAIAAGNMAPQTTIVSYEIDLSNKIKKLHLDREREQLKAAMRTNIERKEKLVAAITEKYNVDEMFARKIVRIANSYQQSDFPKTEDIIAIVGIESSFRPHVKSNLKTDPAVGLMQVRPGVWKIPSEELSTIEGQIKHGANILAHYYDKVGKVEGAVMAYNVGITAYRKGKTNKKYLNKYKTEVAMYK